MTCCGLLGLAGIPRCRRERKSRCYTLPAECCPHHLRLPITSPREKKVREGTRPQDRVILDLDGKKVIPLHHAAPGGCLSTRDRS